MLRIFAAIKITPDERLLQMVERLQRALVNDKIKWVELHNLHITLYFFGETPAEKVEKIADVLNNLPKLPAFSLKVNQIGLFGSRYDPRVIWLGIDPCPPVNQLQKAVISAIQPLGYQTDRQNFVPHITLGRINFLNEKKYFQQQIDSSKLVSAQSQVVSAFHLIESKLRPEGPEYHILRTYRLDT